MWFDIVKPIYMGGVNCEGGQTRSDSRNNRWLFICGRVVWVSLGFVWSLSFLFFVVWGVAIWAVGDLAWCGVACLGCFGVGAVGPVCFVWCVWCGVGWFGVVWVWLFLYGASVVWVLEVREPSGSADISIGELHLL